MQPETPSIIATAVIILIALAPVTGLAIQAWLQRRREKAFSDAPPPKSNGVVPVPKPGAFVTVTFANGSEIKLRARKPRRRSLAKKRGKR